MSNEEPLHTNKEHFNYVSKPIRNEQTGIYQPDKWVLNICDNCNQMTNHLDGICLKCTPKERIETTQSKLNRIITAANVSSVDEVVERLEGRKVDKVLRVSPSREQIAMVDDDGITQIYIRQDVAIQTLRDSQGFLINTDIDDTMECTNTFLQSTLVNAMKFGNETMEHLFVSLGERLGKFKPLSDEEIEQAAIDYANSNKVPSCDYECSELEKAFIQGANFANRQQAGWIDVKDRLPKEEGEYLIYNGELDDIQVSYYDMISWGYLASVIPNVTHWQPLPPKPKQ